jgi:predicted Zn-dependent peptidase
MFASKALSVLTRSRVVKPNALKAKNFSTFADATDVHQTTLANGLKVISVEASTPSSSVSLFINGGSRTEDPHNPGLTHFLKYVAFRDSHKKLALRLVRDIEATGSTFTSGISRESVEYHISGMPPYTKNMVLTLGCVINPVLDQWEVDDIKHSLDSEVASLEANPETQVFEAIHREAFRNQALGNPLYCPSYNVHNVSYTSLRDHVARTFSSDRMVLFGAGVNHNDLVSSATTHFESAYKSVAPAKPQTKYVGGGEFRLPGHGATHVAVVHEGTAITSNEWFAHAVLQHVIGGGVNSLRFRPGQGRSSRLFRDVVEPNTWMVQANAFNLSYSDAGLFGLYAEAQQGHASAALDAVFAALKSIKDRRPTDEEVSKGRALLKSSFLATVQHPAQLAEFYATQAFNGQTVVSPAEFLKKVDSVSTADVNKALDKILASKATVVAVGDIYGMKKY